jgi:hypothetical protein
MVKQSDHDRLYQAIIARIDQLRSYPGWQEFQTKRIGNVLFYADNQEFGIEPAQIGDFEFGEPVNSQHAIIYSYMGLSLTLESLKDCEYYFRRYPFQGLPVTHDAHLGYICEMYFSRFYEFKERSKNTLNLVSAVYPDHKIKIGNFIKLYEKEFDQELRQRNSVNHRSRFETIEIDQIFMAEVMATGKKHDNAWRQERRRHYRNVSAEWAQRVRDRSSKVDSFLNAIAAFLLEVCDFLPLATDP